MKAIMIIAITFVLISCQLSAQDNLSDQENYWPHWRGPQANGLVPSGDPPIKWDEDTNVKWKIEIPGKGHATPVIWKDQVILLSAVPTDTKALEEPEKEDPRASWMNPTSTDYIHKFMVISVDRRNGDIQWQTTVREVLPHSHTHQFGSWASNSPVTDGKHIYAYFGSQGLYCLDMNGKVKWERDFGIMEKHMSFGEGSSPVLYEDKLLLLRDHNGQSYLHILDKNTGKDILNIERDEQTSWSTPFLVNFEGTVQIITSATSKIRSYDASNGELIWECSGMTRNCIPMPVSENGLVYIMSGFRGAALLAIDLSKAEGDITDTDAIAWKYDINTSYTPSPVLIEDKLYFLKANNGFLSCLDARDGTAYYSSQRLEGIQNIFASLVAVNNRIYITGANGSFSVLKQGPDFEVLSQNNLDDSFHASPAIIGDELYLRGFKYLYCISKK